MPFFDLRASQKDVLRAIGSLMIIMILAGFTFVRNMVWDTKLSLWYDVAQKSGQKSRAHNNLGNCYMLLDMPLKAVEEYRIAIQLDAGNIEAYYNIAMNYETAGMPHQAASYYEHFCRSAPPVYEEQRRSSCEAARALAGANAGGAGTRR